MGVSGVTISTGGPRPDGRRDAPGMGRESSIVNQLRPYLSRSKAAAVDALHRLPLTFSQAVADELDAAMLNHHITKIADYYDPGRRSAGPVCNSAWQAQSVIVGISISAGSTAQISQHLEGFRQSGRRDATAHLKNGDMERL